MEHPDLKQSTILQPERIINVSQTDNNIRVCGAGWTTKAYDFDGINYACQHFLPLSVGEEKATESLNIKFHGKLISDSMMNESCLNCVLRNVCNTCYGANYAATGDIFSHDENMCKLFKIQFQAIAYFVSKLVEQGKFDKSILIVHL